MWAEVFNSRDKQIHACWSHPLGATDEWESGVTFFPTGLLGDSQTRGHAWVSILIYPVCAHLLGQPVHT